MAGTKEIDLEKIIDVVEDLTPEEKEEIKKWLRSGISLEFLVTGKTGAGKSSLLNFLLGTKIFKEGENRNEACTTEVHFEDSEKNGIKIRAWDSPGLQDGTSDDRYLKDMKEKCTKIDLMMYCISMEELRSDLLVHASAIKKINALFTKQHWKNTIFVLTFANTRVEILKWKQTPEAELKIGLEDRIKQWKEAIQEALKNMDVDQKIIDNILVVPAGHPNELHLPGYSHWISDLWSKCLISMKTSAQVAFIKMEIQGPQGGFILEHDATEENIGKISAEERKIVYTPGVKIAIGAAAGGVIATGIAVGATIGATIGGLLIGIPSFGVAAGAGLGIGGIVGGAIGGGLAIGIGALITFFRKRKLNRTD